MLRQCCMGEGPSRLLARRRAGAAASILPAAVLILLPKCPLCLAAWLTFATGIGVSAAAAAWMRASIVAFCVAALAFAAVQIVRRSRAPALAAPPSAEPTGAAGERARRRP